MFVTPRNIREKSTRKRIKQFYLFNLILVYLIVSAFVFVLLNHTQPVPLIDEIFHIPQAISYIKGNFSEVEFYIGYLWIRFINSFKLHCWFFAVSTKFVVLCLYLMDYSHPYILLFLIHYIIYTYSKLNQFYC